MLSVLRLMALAADEMLDCLRLGHRGADRAIFIDAAAGFVSRYAPSRRASSSRRLFVSSDAKTAVAWEVGMVDKAGRVIGAEAVARGQPSPEEPTPSFVPEDPGLRRLLDNSRRSSARSPARNAVLPVLGTESNSPAKAIPPQTDSLFRQLGAMDIGAEQRLRVGLQDLPNELWAEIASHMDQPTRSRFRLVSKAAASNAAVAVKSVVVSRRESLLPALLAYEEGGITRLTVDRFELGDQEAKILAAHPAVVGNEVARLLATSTSIQSLDLTRLGIGVVGARYLAANSSITSLDLSHNKVGDEGARLLAANTSIRTLNLTENHIGVKGARYLAANTSITSLVLSDNEFGVEGARLLATNTSIRSLNVNRVGVEGAKYLAANFSITTLTLNGVDIRRPASESPDAANPVASNTSSSWLELANELASLDERQNDIGDLSAGH